MEKLTIACATDDKNVFTNEHFGEAKEYLIYEVSKTDTLLLDTIVNKSPEEKMHGDPNKAKGVASLLKPLGVKVLVSKVFGQNIKRMKQKFVVVLSNEDGIVESIKNIQINFETIVKELEAGENRNHLRI